MALALACVWSSFASGVIQTYVFEEGAFVGSSSFSELLPVGRKDPLNSEGVRFFMFGTSESAVPF